MSERKIFRPGADQVPAAYEWVSLDGGDVCVWEMTAADSVRIIDRVTRAGVDQNAPKGGLIAIYQIINSCYDRESGEPGAQRIFAEHDLPAVYALKFHEWDKLTDAINRLCQKTTAADETLRDFTTATEAQNPSA